MNNKSTGYQHHNLSETHLISNEEVMSKITSYLKETSNQVFRCEFILKDHTVHSQESQVKYKGKQSRARRSQDQDVVLY